MFSFVDFLSFVVNEVQNARTNQDTKEGHKEKSLNPKARLMQVWRGPALSESKAPPPASQQQNLFRSDRLNHHSLPNSPRSLNNRPVILANKVSSLPGPNVQARLHPRPALPHDNRATRNQLPAKRLKSQPLRIRVAPVSRNTLPFFMCHNDFP